MSGQTDRQAQGERNGVRREKEEEEDSGDVMCCDVVADRRSHGGPATRRGAELLYYRPYPRCCKVAGVLMRVRIWGEDKRRLFA